ncbi:MAG: hypothetical protein Q8K75_01160 [Chlamydiales bacterium]|nr:hypothetical protein [Chlamydiales bacterium]
MNSLSNVLFNQNHLSQHTNFRSERSVQLDNILSTRLSVDQALHVEKSIVEGSKVLKGLKLPLLKKTLSLCPHAYQFMSLNCLINNLIIQVFDKIKDNPLLLEKTIVKLNLCISNIYKAEINNKIMLFDNSNIEGLNVLIEEIENEEMKKFLTSLRDNIENILTINKFKKKNQEYLIPDHSNFFNVPISRILLGSESSLYQSIQEKERTRIYMGTFLPLMARTGFELSEFVSTRVSQLVDQLVKNKIPSLVTKLPSYHPQVNRNMMTWMIQKYLLTVLDFIKKADTNRDDIENSCVRPILEVLSPSYISQLLEYDNMTDLNGELENFSDECDKLGRALVNHQEAVSKDILIAESFFAQFSVFLQWSYSANGMEAYTLFCNQYKTTEQKIKYYINYFNCYSNWSKEYLSIHQTAGMFHLINETDRKLVDSKSSEYQEWQSIVKDIKTIYAMIVVMRLQIRTHVNMVNTYESLKQNRIEITLSDENPDHSVLQATHDASIPVLQDNSNQPSSNITSSNEPEPPGGKANDMPAAPSPQAPVELDDDPRVAHQNPASADGEIAYSEETAEAVAMLHETIGQSFETFTLTHPLANQALKDAHQAHQNLVAELMLPADVTEPAEAASHANALVRFTSTMMEGLVTAFVIEQQQPQGTEYAWLKHNILTRLKDNEIDPRFVNTAWRSSQLEQRMRYLHTDENPSQNPILDLLRQAEFAATKEELSVIMPQVYEFVRINLQAVSSVFNIGNMDFTHIAGNYRSPKPTALPSNQLANRLVGRLDSIGSQIEAFLKVSPPTARPAKPEVANYMADAAHLLNLVKVRLQRNSNIAVEYFELSTLLPLAIESLIISIAGRPGGTIDLAKFNRKRIGHNLLELYTKNKIGPLLKNFRVINTSHTEFMNQSRTLLSLTRYCNIQRMTKGNKLNKSLVNQVKLSTATKVNVQGDEWTPAPSSKKTHHGQRQLRHEMLQRAEKGISFVQDLLEVFLNLHHDASQLTA